MKKVLRLLGLKTSKGSTGKASESPPLAAASLKTMDEKHQLKQMNSFEIAEENEKEVDCGKEAKEEDAERKPIEDKAEGSFPFDVFISFRGEDTRKGFTSHLHKELKTRGIKTFSDSEDLERGEEISNILFKHMERSKMFVPVFSKNYADSKWCLREIAKMVEIKEREGGKRDIIPVFYEVEPAVVKHCTGSFGESFEKHQHDERLDDMQINEWKAALTKAAGFSGCPSDAQGNEAKLITLIGQEVSKKLCKVPFDIQPVGIDLYVHTLEEMLEREKDGVQMIGIWGLGGIGKTTLAMALYNKLSTRFKRSCFLSNIREKKSELLPYLQAQFMNKVLGETMSIDNVSYGVSLMKRRLGSQKVLLVLDGVDKIEQLRAFTANRGEMGKKEEWFGGGSKIIVTTRDKEVLLQHGLQEEDIYCLKGLNREDSLQLFYRHAFLSNSPLEGFKMLSWKVVEVAKGLPLALEVFGKLFKNLKEKQEWEEMLKKLKSDQDNEVYERLKISYDSLDRYGKSVFLDIACSFIGKIRKYPFYMWEACCYSPITTLKALQHKSLITINEDDIIEMHDQIRDMGRMKMDEEGKYDPLEYSRLWRKDQVLKVLMNAKPRRCVQIMDFTEVSEESETTKTSWNAIAAMPNLRMITGANRNHVYEDQEGIIRLPSNIRWFGWKPCPYQTLTFHEEPHKHILVLDLQYGELQDLRSHRMEFPNLKVLDLSYCNNLIQTRDFTHVPSLEVLTLDCCWSFVEMDDSIGHLKKLVRLSMRKCRQLKKLPAGLCKLTSLESLDLTDCWKISDLPTQIGDLRSLKHLGLGGTSISALPDSIGSLQSLQELYLSSTYLSALPDSIGRLRSLKKLLLVGCTRISILPKQIRGLTSLKYLALGGSTISALPDSIGSLQSLETLDLEGCKGIYVLPKQIGNLTSLKHLKLQKSSISDLPDSIESLRSLEELNLRGCTRISILPKEIRGLTSLKCLTLGWSSMSALPDSIGSLQSLEVLNFGQCQRISILPKEIGDLRSLKYLKLNGTSISALPDSIGSLQSLKHLYLDGCFSLEKLPDSIEGLKRLSLLSLYGCKKLEQLPNSMGMLTSLKKLDIRKCKSLREVPASLVDLNNDIQISLKGCISLEKLPNSIRISAGYSFEFDGCKSLKRLPDSLGDGMSTVCKLSFSGCESLEEIPESLGMRLEYLEDLDLSGCSLLTKIPESIGKLKSLKRLILKHCQSLEELAAECISMSSLEELDLSGCTLLTRIPESIGKLKSLKRLILKHCQSLAELPAECSSMLSLEELDLSGCISIKSIPESIGDLRLRHLSIEDCRSLKELPESMEGLESLKVLRIGGGMSVKKVPDFIRKLTNLQNLYLREIDDIPEYSIDMLRSLEELHFSACSSLRMIPESIRDLNCLKLLILLNCQSLETLPKSMQGLESLKMLCICGGMSVSVNKKLPDFMRKLKDLQKLVLSELEEIPELIGGFPPMGVILIEDCPKLESLPQLPSSLTRLAILGCAAFKKLSDLSTLSCLEELYLVGCKAFTDMSGLGSLKSLRELALIDPDGLSGDLMEKLSQASFEKLDRLLISGASDSSDLLFGLPKSKTGRIVALHGRCYLTEKLPSDTSDINIRIQVVVEGMTVTELTCTATREGEDGYAEDDNSKDDGAEGLEKWGLGGRVFYKISIQEGYKIFKCVKEGNPMCTSEIEEVPMCTSEIEEEDCHPEAHKMLGLEEEGEIVRIAGFEEELTCTLEIKEEDCHPEAHKMLGLEDEGEIVRFAGWGMLRVPTNYSFGRLSMAFFEVSYGDGSTSSSRMLRSY